MNHVIAVAGPPGAGKTALVRGLVQSIGDACAIHMDSYEKITRAPIEEIAQWMKNGADIDAFEFPQLPEDLQRLRQGQAVVDPLTGREVAPRKYILFETQFGRAHQATGRHIGLLIWIDTPLDVALARNMRAFAGAALNDRESGPPQDKLRWMHDYFGHYLGTVRSLLVMQRQRVSGEAELVLDGQAELPALVQSARTEILRRLP